MKTYIPFFNIVKNSNIILMNLLIEYHTPKNTERNREYIQCIENNINSKLFKTITIFAEDDLPSNISDSSIVKVVRTDKRRKYKDFFNYCNDNYMGQICVLSNTDIYFDNSLKFIESVDMNNRLLALTRWDEEDGLAVLHDKEESSRFSQDTWIFKPIVSFKNSSNISGGDFYMGIPGCDNRIAAEFHLSGYKVSNPCLSIKSYHLHNSRYRTYTNDNRINKPYLYVYKSKEVSNKNKKLLMNKRIGR